MQRRTGIPSSLVIGAVALVAGSATFALAAISRVFDAEQSFDAVVRWSAFSSGVAIAAILLIAGGVFSLAGRSSGWSRSVLQVAGAIYLVYLAWLLGRPFALELVGDAKAEWLYEYGWRIASAFVWVAPVLLSVAARAWWRPATPWVTVAAVVLVVLEAVTWAPYVAGWFGDLGHEHPIAGRLIWPLREVLTSGALLLLVHGIARGAAPALPMPDQGARWLRLASASLMIRVTAAIVLALLGIGIVKSPHGVKFVLIVAPVITMSAVMVFVWSLLSVDNAELPGMPRLRLVLGAGLTALGAGLQLNQLLAMFRVFSERSGSFEAQQAEMWTVIGPLISAVGMVLACSAIAGWAGRMGDLVLRETAIARATLHAVLSLVVLGLPYLAKTANSAGALVVSSLLVIGAAIASIVVVATVFRRAAEAITPSPALPEARLR